MIRDTETLQKYEISAKFIYTLKLAIAPTLLHLKNNDKCINF